jgi:hypothetical protein
MILGATGCTRDGLCMVSSIIHIDILTITLFTEFKIFHSCAFSIIGDIFDQAIAGAANGAIGEGKKISSIQWIK